MSLMGDSCMRQPIKPLDLCNSIQITRVLGCETKRCQNWKAVPEINQPYLPKVIADLDTWATTYAFKLYDNIQSFAFLRVFAALRMKVIS